MNPIGSADPGEQMVEVIPAQHLSVLHDPALFIYLARKVFRLGRHVVTVPAIGTPRMASGLAAIGRCRV